MWPGQMPLGGWDPIRFTKTSKVSSLMSHNLENRRSALCPWFERTGAAFVHKDDYDKLKALVPFGRVFDIEGASDEYISLRFGAEVFRVKASLVREVPRTRYRVGEKVEVAGKNGSVEIFDIRWHYKKGQPIYFIKSNGKESGKWYWDADFSQVTS